jgi:hypothetical protein
MHERQFLALVVDSPDGNDPNGETVALFERSQIAAVIARRNLVSEERGEPIGGRFAGAGGDDAIPF